VIDNGKNLSWGEATALPGYSWETANSIWEVITQRIEKSGHNLNNLKDQVYTLLSKSPFAVSAILTAIEKFYKLIDFSKVKKGEIPLVGIVKGESPNELAVNVEKALKNGYKVLKVKLLGNIEEDIERVKTIEKVINSKIKLRLDANQSYDYKAVKLLLEKINLDNIELLEQPFRIEEWDLVKKLVKWSPIPIMLDESIWTREDLKKAFESGIKIVKVKLMKHGGILNTFDLIISAKELGLEVILGNGVQTDLGCIDEAFVYSISKLNYGGEMNGFLKLVNSFIHCGIEFKNGEIFVDFQGSILNKESLETFEKYIVKKYDVIMSL